VSVAVDERKCDVVLCNNPLFHTLSIQAKPSLKSAQIMNDATDLNLGGVATRSSGSADRDDRGRHAERPTQIPARGWWDVAWRAAKRFSDDNVTLVAGGLAMYALLSVFPALAATVSIYGMFATPSDVIQQMSTFSGVLPPGVWDIFNTELQSIAKTGQTTLTFAAVLGTAVALWSARSAMSSLMTATNIAYRERESRGFIEQSLLSLAFTLGAVLGFLVMLTLGVAIPLALSAFGAADWTKAAVSVLRLLLLWAVMVIGFAVLYRYAPARQHARWRWVFPGSLFGATLWMMASGVFAFYVTNFAGYAKTYGALGGVVVLLMWFFISSIVVVLGAQVNAESERQTTKDTTDLRGAPMGERGAFAADTIGPEASSDKPVTRNEEPIEPTHHTDDSPGAARTYRKASASVTNAAVAGHFIRSVAAAANPRRSKVMRWGAAASAARQGIRLLPVGIRLIQRHPVASSLALVGLLWALRSTHPRND